jgi:hypothetical protein
MAIAAVIAAMVAVAGLGWGAVMAGRASRLEQIRAASSQRAGGFERIVQVIQQFPTSDAQASHANLESPDGNATGAGLTIGSKLDRDLVMVMLSGLKGDAGPYRVVLLGRGGIRLPVGMIHTLDSGGSGEISRRFLDDLTRYDRVVVRDGSGRRVLHGSFAMVTDLPSPGP